MLVLVRLVLERELVEILERELVHLVQVLGLGIQELVQGLVPEQGTQVLGLVQGTQVLELEQGPELVQGIQEPVRVLVGLVQVVVLSRSARGDQHAQTKMQLVQSALD